MKVIQINTCNECPNYDHSGGFTPGGAKPQCAAIQHRGRTFRELPYTYSGRNGNRVPTYEIPSWCPLEEKK